MEFDENGYYDMEDDLLVLIKKAWMFELMELHKIIVNRKQLLVLDKLLNDGYVTRRPKPSEYEDRKQVIRVLNDIAKDLYGSSVYCPIVEEFGSFLMDLFTTGSDLDLSINFINIPRCFTRDQKIKTLREFERKLYSLQSAGHVQKVQPILRAIVPILKFVHTATGVECDISVENWDGMNKSSFIRIITSIDERFQKLCVLMKAWAKAHDINSPKDRTLNSISIISLVAFHLQTRDSPILPPFSEILKDGEDTTSVKNSVRNFQNYGRRNTETLGELFVSFLIMLASVEDLWQKGLCASPYLGNWTSKTWDNKIAIMSVEDFMDRTQNVARTVGRIEVKRIYKCINFTIENLRLFMNVKIDELKLEASIFGISSMYQSTRPLPPGHRYLSQHQPVDTVQEMPWAYNSAYHQPRVRVTEGVPSTGRRGLAWGRGIQGYRGGEASTSNWVGANGATFMDDHNRLSQEIQEAMNLEEEDFANLSEEEDFANHSEEEDFANLSEEIVSASGFCIRLL